MKGYFKPGKMLNNVEKFNVGHSQSVQHSPSPKENEKYKDKTCQLHSIQVRNLLFWQEYLLADIVFVSAY